MQKGDAAQRGRKLGLIAADDNYLAFAIAASTEDLSEQTLKGTFDYRFQFRRNARQRDDSRVIDLDDDPREARGALDLVESLLSITPKGLPRGSRLEDPFAHPGTAAARHDAHSHADSHALEGSRFNRVSLISALDT